MGTALASRRDPWKDGSWYGQLELCRDRLKRPSVHFTRGTQSIVRLLVITEQSEKETHDACQKHSHDTSFGAVPMRQKAF